MGLGEKRVSLGSRVCCEWKALTKTQRHKGAEYTEGDGRSPVGLPSA